MRPVEFIRRFLLHILPRGFMKIRHYGLVASVNVKTRLARARQLLKEQGRVVNRDGDGDGDGDGEPEVLACPHCGSLDLVLYLLSPVALGTVARGPP